LINGSDLTTTNAHIRGIGTLEKDPLTPSMNSCKMSVQMVSHTNRENRGQAMLYAISGKTVPLSFPRDVT